MLKLHEREYILTVSEGKCQRTIHRTSSGTWIVHAHPKRNAVGIENKQLSKYNPRRIIDPHALHDVTNEGVTGQWIY